jgi:hypothetical protein
MRVTTTGMTDKRGSASLKQQRLRQWRLRQWRLRQWRLRQLVQQFTAGVSP